MLALERGDFDALGALGAGLAVGGAANDCAGGEKRGAEPKRYAADSVSAQRAASYQEEQSDHEEHDADRIIYYPHSG